MNPIFKTGIDTVVTTGVIAPELYGEPLKQATETMINTGDFKAPVIALVSSVVIQFVLKGLNLLFKKIFPSNV